MLESDFVPEQQPASLLDDVTPILLADPVIADSVIPTHSLIRLNLNVEPDSAESVLRGLEALFTDRQLYVM